MTSPYEQFVTDQVKKITSLPAAGNVLDQVFRSPLLKRYGTWCEFGVGDGTSLRRLADERGVASLWGFDVFTGLPKDWIAGYARGAFKQESIPLVEGAHVVSGLFSETLPWWKIGRPVMLCHIDCDLHDGAVEALVKVLPDVRRGSIIVFDEIYNVADFEKNEMLALWQTMGSPHLAGAPEWEWVFANPGGSDQAAALIIK